jgi:DNA gyrase subunit A
MATTAKNGPLVGAVQVSTGDEIMLISDQGTAVRTRVEEISTLGRNTQGVRVIKTREDEKLVRLSRIVEDDDAVPEAEAAETVGSPESGVPEANGDTGES